MPMSSTMGFVILQYVSVVKARKEDGTWRVNGREEKWRFGFARFICLFVTSIWPTSDAIVQYGLLWALIAGKSLS